MPIFHFELQKFAKDSFLDTILAKMVKNALNVICWLKNDIGYGKKFWLGRPKPKFLDTILAKKGLR